MANENANRKFIQFFRNQATTTGLFADKAAAIAKLTGTDIDPNVLKDGMPIVARYKGDTYATDGKIYSVLGIGHTEGNVTKVTVFDNINGIEDAIKALDATVSATTNGVTVQVVETDGKLTDVSITSVDLGTLANYSKTTSGTGVLATGDTIADAFAKLEKAIDDKMAALDSNVTAGANQYFTGIELKDGKLVGTGETGSQTTVANVDSAQIVDYTAGTGNILASTDTIHGAFKKLDDAIIGMDAPSVSGENNVVIDVVQTDGTITATSTAITSVKIGGYTVGSDADVAATDTLGEALGKLQGQINAMDLPVVSGEGQAIIAVSEEDGKVSATAGDIAAAHVTTVTAGTQFTGTTVQAALEEIASKVEANEISSSAKTITVTTAATGTNIDVNIDGLTVVKDGSTGVLSTGLKLVQSAGTGTTKETYTLTDVSGNAITGSDVITIPKDSAFVTGQLGHSGATVDSSTGEITDGSGQDVLILEYLNNQGQYMIVEIPLGDFLRESEFKDGLQVNNGEVSVKVDSASESVVTGDSASGAVLSVSANGVKVSNIQNAIDYKVSTLDADVSGQSADEHVTVKVVETDGKVTAVTVTTSDLASASALTAEIAARKAVDGINGDEYSANTGSNYITGATSLNDADVKLDAALKAEETARTAQDDKIEAGVGLKADGGYSANTNDHYVSAATSVTDSVDKLDAALYGLSGKAVTTVAMTGGSASTAANADGTLQINIDTDGGQIYLDDYVKASGSSAVTSDDTVNSAIGKLEYKVDAASSGLQAEVDAIETAVGLNADGTHASSTGHYTSGAATIEGEIVALDTQLSAVSNTYVGSGVTGNNGVTVETSAGNETSGKTITVALKLDTVTNTTETTAQYASATGNALQITTGENGGLYLDSTWDCGFYE